MIHNVYFWMTEEARAAHRDDFVAALRELLEIDLIEAGYMGSPAGTEVRPVTDNTFDFAISLHFASQADHDAYQVHPDHDRFVDSKS